jgi:carboxymethylenebutenolidase
LAVDLYDGELAQTPDRAGELAGEVRENVEPAFDNLEAATEYLAGLDMVDEDQLASVGWCFGGQWAYSMAVNDINVDASVIYYGHFMPEDDLSMMRADILGHFGEEDTSIPVDTVREFEAKLETLEGDHAVFIYPNAGHAFANEDREDAYNEEAAELAWERTLDFLAREVQ